MEGCSNSERDSSDERDIRPGGRLLFRSFPTRQQFALVGSKTVGRQCTYGVGVKAVERLLTSVQFFASAPRYRKAVVFVNTNRPKAFALTYKLALPYQHT